MKSSGSFTTNALFTLFITASLMLSLAAADDSPVPPHAFYGSLTIDGEPAPAGSQIVAKVGSEDRTRDSPYVTAVLGEYGSGLDRLLVDCETDEAIDFFVDGREANEHAVCHTGAVDNFPLTVGEGGPACEQGDTRPCANQNGVCSGSMETCAGGGYWPGCNASNYGPDYEADEVSCDGLDNDCDGLTDEDITRSCYEGPQGTEGVGICSAGTQSCSAGEWGACTGQSLPEAESCNGLDDDCDGVLDGSEELSRQCGVTDVGACEYGLQWCLDDGSYGACDGNVDPAPESCDNQLDDDCDGFTDCLDTADCFEHEACLEPEYCIEITSLKILDSNFEEASFIDPGTMYNIEVTNENTCESPIESMQVVRISTGGTPVNIGTVTSTIDALDSSVITAGFVLDGDTVPGTQFDVEAFNWLHWISGDPEPWEVLSAPEEASFEAAGGL